MSEKKVLREYYKLCPDGFCEDYLTESEKKRRKKDGVVYLTGTIQRANAKNGNGRIYPKPVLEREVKLYQEIIKENRALGELNHPKESAEIDLKNVCHIVEDVWWEGDELKGKLRVLKHHPSGQILEGLIKDGVQICISSRGLGTVNETEDGILVEDDFQLICFDIVQEPSTKDAYLMQESKVQNVNRKLSKSEKIQIALIDILN